MRSLHVLLVFAWVSARCSGFLPPGKTCLLRVGASILLILSLLEPLGNDEAASSSRHASILSLDSWVPRCSSNIATPIGACSSPSNQPLSSLPLTPIIAPYSISTNSGSCSLLDDRPSLSSFSPNQIFVSEQYGQGRGVTAMEMKEMGL